MRKPIVHGYFLCWNEEYILPHLLNHYKDICDEIFILDNYSDDSSHQILKKFKEETGKNVRILAFDTNQQYRDDIFLNMANNTWKKYSRGNCDYVIFADADEFVCHPNMNQFLTEKFNENYSILITKGYHMIADKECVLTTSDNIHEVVNKGIYSHFMDKPMIFNPNKIEEMNFCVGRHTCNPFGDVKVYRSNGEYILKHFKYLGLENFLFRVERYQKRFSDVNKRNGWATYWLEEQSHHINDYNTKVEERVSIC